MVYVSVRGDKVRASATAACARPPRPTLTALAERVAALLERASLDPAHAEQACEVAEQLLARGRADRARELAEHAIAALPARARLIAARAAAASGAYRDALALAHGAEAAGADPIEAQLIVARAAQRAGDLDAAETTLAQLHATHREHVEIAGAYARLLVTRSRYADARRVANAAGPLAGLRAEAAGLAAFYLGELDDADRAFAALELAAAATGDAATVGRALSLRGMVAQQRGQLGLASDRYRDAARRLGEVGEIHAAAVAELNLGTALTERGRASEALPRLAAASRVFAELGATTEQVAADLNRGSALLVVGQAADARLAAEAAIERADGAPHLRAFALLVLGDAHRRLGDDAGAERAYRDALAIGLERGDAHAQVSAYIALAEAGHAVAVDVDALCASDDDRDRWTIARGRLALRGDMSRDTGLARGIALDHRAAHTAMRIAVAPRVAEAEASSSSRARVRQSRRAPRTPIDSSAHFAVMRSPRSSPSAVAIRRSRAARPIAPALRTPRWPPPPRRHFAPRSSAIPISRSCRRAEVVVTTRADPRATRVRRTCGGCSRCRAGSTAKPMSIESSTR